MQIWRHSLESATSFGPCLVTLGISMVFTLGIGSSWSRFISER